MIIKEAVPFDVLLLGDMSKRNVLHWAVINKQKDLIEVIISKLDADRAELRQ